VAVRAPVLCEPDNGLLPDQEPEATQDVAFVEVHEIIDELPDTTEVGEAVIVTTGRRLMGAKLATSVLLEEDVKVYAADVETIAPFSVQFMKR